MTETEALIALNQLPKIGPIRIRTLVETFGSGVKVLSQSPTILQEVRGIGPDSAKMIADWENHSDPTAEIAMAKDREITILTRESDDYPAALADSPDAPAILYVWGELQERDIHSIGIVGSRKLTHYGRETARKFAYQVAGAGMTVISGLARGIDTAAHEGAIAAKARTIAVLGSGIMKVYPPENLTLAERIADGHGAVISEFPLLTQPDRQTFPQRNRIVAYWGRALLVVECPSRSGSLITANFAADAGRHIYAVPGPIDRPTSAGCHDLIRDGATLVTDGSQILDDFSHLSLKEVPGEKQEAMVRAILDLTDEENAVMKAIGQEEFHIDEITRASGIAAHQVSVILMKLELRNLVINLPGQRFRKR